MYGVLDTSYRRTRGRERKNDLSVSSSTLHHKLEQKLTEFQSPNYTPSTGPRALASHGAQAMC